MAESAEKRKDARTAREWIVALPAELDAAQRKNVALEFGKELASRYGVAVDVAIHLPDAGGNNRNHHAHILTTTRKMELDDAGSAFLGDKASIELSDKKRRSLGLDSAADEIKDIRHLWQETANTALEKAGIQSRIDARSLKEQGIDREPTVHMGYIATEMERKGIETDRGNDNRQVAQNNALREEYADDLINYSEMQYLEHVQQEKNKPEINPIQTEVSQPVIAQPEYKTRKEFVRAQCLKADKIQPKVTPLLQKSHQTQLSLHGLNKNLEEKNSQVGRYRQILGDYLNERDKAGFFEFKKKKYLDKQIEAIESGLQKAKAEVIPAQKALRDAEQSIQDIQQMPEVKEYLNYAEFYKELRAIEESGKTPQRQQAQEIDEDDDYEFEYD